MKYVLITMCDCRQTIQGTYPPPAEVLMPIHSRFAPFPALTSEPRAEPAFKVRRFKLYDWINIGPRESVADYYEVE